MPTQRLFNEDQVRSMERLYRTPVSLAAVAKAFHCSQATVHKYFRDYGVECHPQGYTLRTKRHTPEQDDVAAIEWLYWGCGLTAGQTARRMGLSLTALLSRMARHGIPQRPHSENVSRGCKGVKKTLSEEQRRVLSQKAKEGWAADTFVPPAVRAARARREFAT